MSHKLPRLSAQAILLAALSLLLVFGLTLGVVFAQGLDLNRHCQNHGRERAVNTDGTAYGWKCEDSSGVLWDISVESACDEQYGNSYTAQYSNFNDPNSWYCQAPANQQQNDDTGGQGSQQQQQQPQSSYSGGIDMVGYCVSQGRSGATFTDDAYSWICTNSDGSRATDVNVDAACVYSSGGTHPYAGFTDINNPYSWYCATTPQGRPSSGGNPAPQTQPTSAPQTSPSFNYCDFAPVSVGETAQITAGRSNRLRSGAGTGYSQIGSLQPGTQFTIVSGPTCANGYNWYQVRLSNGTTGFTAAGSYGDQWIARVGTSSNGSGNTVSPTTPNQQGRWCSASPSDADNYGWSRDGHTLPNPRIELHFNPDVNLGLNGQAVEHYIYYLGEWVGPDVAQWEGWRPNENVWSIAINTRWYVWQNVVGTFQEGQLAEHVTITSNWRIDYWRADGLCTFN